MTCPTFASHIFKLKTKQKERATKTVTILRPLLQNEVVIVSTSQDISLFKNFNTLACSLK